MDFSAERFDPLFRHGTNRTVQCDRLDREAFLRSGIEPADALPAVTASGNVNVSVRPFREAAFPLLDTILTFYVSFLPPV